MRRNGKSWNVNAKLTDAQDARVSEDERDQKASSPRVNVARLNPTRPLAESRSKPARRIRPVTLNDISRYALRARYAQFSREAAHARCAYVSARARPSTFPLSDLLALCVLTSSRSELSRTGNSFSGKLRASQRFDPLALTTN